ncbi:GTP-binding protein [Spirulina subsalsa FACHB-351]|uniref:GTP-binding protein n=1 Tax=Spirulina subsalsa FACHB-351 TaxID=234711 RepID=A0ABT3L965_9CYAN|nr:GTP-binding protein [Spirulina subsalsa]MCW6038048.1 GTP-binding protein [Spirulina subsalsa FACHB-351]
MMTQLKSQSPGLYIVSGPAGSGKTHWIFQQLSKQTGSQIYGAPSQSSWCLDSAYLESQLRGDLQNLNTRNLAEIEGWALKSPVYLELGFHLDLQVLPIFSSCVPCHKIAVLPSGLAMSEWHFWADNLVLGVGAMNPQMPSQIQKSDLTGEVFDPASLDMVWYELTHGAYGEVQRAKGIFNVVDGRSFWFSFVAGQDSYYEELNRPRCLESRPGGLSGIEVCGQNLDTEAIASNLAASCLNDQLLSHYQAQYRSYAANSEVVS